MLYISLPQKIPQYAPVDGYRRMGGGGEGSDNSLSPKKKLIVQKIPQYAPDWLLYGGFLWLHV